MQTKVESEITWQPDHRIIKAMWPFVSKDRTRYGLHYVRVVVKGGVATYDATDGHRLARVVVSVVDTPDFSACLDGADLGWLIGGRGHAPAAWVTGVDFPDVAQVIPKADAEVGGVQALNAKYIKQAGAFFEKLFSEVGSGSASKSAITILSPGVELHPCRWSATIEASDYSSVEALVALMPMRIMR